MTTHYRENGNNWTACGLDINKQSVKITADPFGYDCPSCLRKTLTELLVLQVNTENKIYFLRNKLDKS